MEGLYAIVIGSISFMLLFTLVNQLLSETSLVEQFIAIQEMKVELNQSNENVQRESLNDELEIIISKKQVGNKTLTLEKIIFKK